MSLTPALRSSRSLILLATIAIVGACKDSTPPVTPPPAPTAVIAISPATVVLSDTVGTTSPGPVTVAVTNSGNLALTGLAAGAITYGAGANGWLSATISGADAPATLTLTASNTGLAAGTYSASVPVISSIAVNSPQTVQVMFQITGATGPVVPTGPMVLAAGNIAQCGIVNSATSAALIESQDANASVLALGDNVFPRPPATASTAADYTDCYNPTWGRFKARTWAVVGNREQDATGASAGADAYFGTARVGQPGQNYYSFDLGAWHIIMLNVASGGAVTYGNGSAQLNWLIADLQANQGKKCVLAVWHDPYYMSSTTGATSHSTQSGIWQALYNANADLVLNAGQHHYERLAPMDAAGAVDTVGGIRSINSGLGGDGSTMPTTIHPNSEVRGTGIGVTKLVLGDSTYSWQFIAAANTSLTDSGIGRCH